MTGKSKESSLFFSGKRLPDECKISETNLLIRETEEDQPRNKKFGVEFTVKTVLRKGLVI